MASTKNCVFVDFETRSRRDIDDGAFAYAADESTEILCVAYCIEDQEPIVCTPDQKELLAPLFRCIKDGYQVIAHNMLFEVAIFEYVAWPKYGWPSPCLSQYRCTMQMACRAGLPASLAESAIALGVTNKLESGSALLKLFSIPQSNGNFIPLDSRPKEKASLLEYCAIDTVVSRDIWRNLSEWKPEELEDVEFDLISNVRGVPVDVMAATVIYKNILNEQEKFGDRISELTKGIITKPTQVQRIKAWVQKNVNASIPDTSADTVQEILDGKYGDVDPVSQEILEMRQHAGKSSTGKFTRYVNSSINGRIKGMNISFGAHTGRSVSRLLNLYNLPKPSVKYSCMEELVDDLTGDVEAVNQKYGSYLKAASTAIRGIITADDGDAMVVADYAAIEARLVFWLSNSFTGLRKYHEGTDLYKDAASKIYHKPIEQVTESERWLGKQVILGAGFGLGAKGFVRSCANWGVDVPLPLAEEAITAYRESYPEVVDFWNAIESTAIRACKTGEVTYIPNGKIAFKTTVTKSGVPMLQMRLPSGRLITYPHVKLDTVTTPWGAKKMGITYKKVKDGNYFRESTYGGKLTENAIQGIARDLMYFGAKNAAKNGYQILFTIYDELVGTARKDIVDLHKFVELITVLPDWAVGMPLQAEGKVIRRYQKI
jgi:DNA polymerase